MSRIKGVYRTSANQVPEKKIRIYDLKVAQGIDEVLALGDPRYKSFNTVIIEALKYGLPKLLGNQSPTTDDIVRKESDRIISHTNRIYEKMSAQLNKILVSVVLSQEIVTCIVNEVEQILSLNNIELTEEMREQFINNLPEPLSEQYQNLLVKLGLDG